VSSKNKLQCSFQQPLDAVLVKIFVNGVSFKTTHPCISQLHVNPFPSCSFLIYHGLANIEINCVKDLVDSCTEEFLCYGFSILSLVVHVY
jgi:hypothetical protein